MADKVGIKITKIILGVIAVAGVLSVALVAPNVFLIVKMFKKNNPRFRDHIKQALKRLEQRGLIVITKGRVTLTKKGKIELSLYEMKKKLVKHPKNGIKNGEL